MDIEGSQFTPQHILFQLGLNFEVLQRKNKKQFIYLFELKNPNVLREDITSEVKRRHEMTLSLIELICMILCRLPLFPNKKLGREQLETLLRHRKGATKTRTQRMKINQQAVSFKTSQNYFQIVQEAWSTTVLCARHNCLGEPLKESTIFDS